MSASETQGQLQTDSAPVVKKQRNQALDIAKGIAMLSIMVGHMGFIVMGSSGVVTSVMHLYHVPVFFLIAGYFLSKRKPLEVFVKEKALRLLVPFVVTCLMLGLVYFILWWFFEIPVNDRFGDAKGYVLACLYGAGSVNNDLPAGIDKIGAIWFLEALFIGMLVTRLAIIKEKAAPFIVLACFIVGCATCQDFFWPLNIQSGLMSTLYIYIGHLLRKVKFFDRPVKWYWFLLCAVVFVVGAVFSLRVNVACGRYAPFFLGIPVSLMCCWLVIMLSQLIDKHTKMLKRFFLFIGVNSMVIMCFHIVLQKGGIPDLMEDMGVTRDWNILQWANLIVQLLLMYPIVGLVKRTKHFKKIFY